VVSDNRDLLDESGLRIGLNEFARSASNVAIAKVTQNVENENGNPPAVTHETS
jgi:hypothetical protein